MGKWPTKKLGEVTVGIIFVIFAAVLIAKGQEGWSVLLILSLIILLKLDTLTELVLGAKEGLLRANFQSPKEKIEEDIKENKQPVTRQNFARFQHIEAKILANLQKRYGDEMKTQIHFIYGMPGRPEFRYTPDATIQTDKELIFVEIKYILKPEFAQKIVENASQYLKMVLDKFGQVAGKKLVAKLILASSFDINPKLFKVPEDIEIELYKV